MKRIILALALIAGVFFNAAAQNQKLNDVTFENVKIIKNGKLMSITMDIDLQKLNVKNRASLHIVPMLKNGADSVELAPVGIYSRGRYINYLRNGKSIFEDLGETVYKESAAPDRIQYSSNVEYSKWMDGASIYVSNKTCGCCQDFKGQKQTRLAQFEVPKFEPAILLVQPQVEMDKTRELSGSAYIEFVVSRTDINPDYRSNRREIGKITATIDSVRNDSDIEVKKIWLKGFASPESPYDNNTALAKGRTESLKKYVLGLYGFDPSVIETDYEPENWEGLKAYVQASNLPHKAEILEAIGLDRDPDTREWIIKSRYKADYRHLLDHCYPALRKTDYRIEYTIRSFTDIDEIVEIFRTSPNKLSLNEIYLASTAFEPKSEEYNAVFETAVRMYPNDPVSNINAANVAILEGDFRGARRYLLKADDSEEVIYTWGLYYMGVGYYEKAEEKLREARTLGIPQAAEMLRQCARLKAYYEENN